jgi:hypothetical protein
MIHDVEWLQKRLGWPDLRSVIIAGSTRELRGKTERETRLYIGSLDLAAEVVAQVIRDH